jgi:hypothetical protein
MPASTLPKPPVTGALYPACACPACGGDITVQESMAACARCDRSFPIQNDVVDFRLTEDSYYKNPLQQADMHRINEQFSLLPWSETLGQFLQLSGDVPLWLDKIVDEGRYAWKIFLGLRPGTRLLDYGCNLGASTKNLAPHFAQTYAV